MAKTTKNEGFMDLFALYDVPRSRLASEDIKHVVYHAANDLADVLYKHRKVGGVDTATCKAVGDYLLETMRMAISELIAGDRK